MYCLYCVYCFPLWTPKISPIGLELIQFWLDLNFCGLDFFGPGSDLSAKLPTSKMTEFVLFIPRKWPECPILVDFSPIFAREWPNWPIFLSQISNYLVTSSIILVITSFDAGNYQYDAEIYQWCAGSPQFAIKELSIDRITIWSQTEIHFSNDNLSFIFQIGSPSHSQTEIQKNNLRSDFDLRWRSK